MTQTIIPRAAVRGTASGVIFMAFFGTLWAGIGIRGLQGWGYLWLLILSMLVGVVLLVGGIVLIMKSKRLSKRDDGRGFPSLETKKYVVLYYFRFRRRFDSHCRRNLSIYQSLRFVCSCYGSHCWCSFLSPSAPFPGQSLLYFRFTSLPAIGHHTVYFTCKSYLGKSSNYGMVDICGF